MKLKIFSKLVPWTVYAVSVVLLCLITSAAACSFNPDGFTMVTGDYTSPVLEHFIMTDEMTGTISFSHEVSFPRLEYYEVPKNASGGATESAGIVLVEQVVGDANAESVQSTDTDSSPPSVESGANANRYRLNFSNTTDPGIQYILSGTVKDATGSTLTFDIGFTGHNARVPHIIFSEINTKYAKPKTEFVEFYVLEDGNLGGMVLQSGTYGIEKDYVFPVIEVNAGEYLVLHMRSIEDGIVNETGEDLTVSAGKLASDEGRDLWVLGTEKRLTDTDVLLLRERLNGTIIDALLYAESDKLEWSKDLMSTYAREAYNAKIWDGGFEIATAASTDNTTATRTLSRQNIATIAESFESDGTITANRADDWLVVTTSNATPGTANSSNPFLSK